MPFGNHLVFFRIHESAVRIGHLRHAARRPFGIDFAHSTHIVVGTLEEMRAHASQPPPQALAWKFTTDRHGWIYENASDTGWPIQNGLKITHKATPRGAMVSDVLHWQAADAPILEIEAAFTSAAANLELEVEIQPFAPADRTDFPAWEVASPPTIEETARKKKAFPSAPPILIPVTVQGDGQLRTLTLNLANQPAYRGAMKQLRLRLPAADVRRIELR